MEDTKDKHKLQTLSYGLGLHCLKIKKKDFDKEKKLPES
jgi:hypothetical protein